MGDDPVVSQTFACPHCAATYPLRPVLIGKVVRCTACRNPFQLGPDGIAKAVAVAAPPPPAGASPSASAPAAPANDQLELNDPSSAARPATRAGHATPARGTASSVRLTAAQDAARRALSATLQESMAKALEAESVKQEEKKATDRQVKTARQEGKDPQISPAVLTGEGERAASEARSFWLVLVAVVLVVVALGWFLAKPTPERRALDAWCAPVDQASNHGPQRVKAIRARAWLPEVPIDLLMPFVALESPKLSQVVTVPSDALHYALELTAGLEPISELHVWCPPDQRAAVSTVVAGLAALVEKSPATFALKMKEKKLTVVTDREVVAAIAKGVSDESVHPWLFALLSSRSGTAAGPLALKLRSSPPKEFRFRAFQGEKGLLLMEGAGLGNQTRTMVYQGMLMQAVGKDWPEGWRMIGLGIARP